MCVCENRLIQCAWEIKLMQCVCVKVVCTHLGSGE